jgi:hypothetical protein
MATTPTTPDIFDQLAQPQTQPGQTAQAAPVTDSQPQPTQTTPQGQGDIFDQLSSRNASPSTVASPSPSQQTVTPQQPSITATPEPTNVGGQVERWARNLSEDLKYGTDLTGIGTVLKKMGAHGVYSGNPAAVGDFMASLPLGLSKVVTGMGEVAQPGKRVQGAKDTVSGTLQAATIPGSVVGGPEAVELAGNGLDAGATAAGKAVDAAKGAFDVNSAQHPLQQSIRAVLKDVADKAGVTVPDTSSIRDVAATVSDAVKAKASGLYKQLDAATGGGRFQRFDEALENIRQALRDTVGLDDEKEAELIGKQAETEKARQAALDTAAKAGVDASIIKDANATWRQQSALSDLSNSLRQSVTGQRPAIADAAKAANSAAQSSPETVNAKTLFAKINRLNDRGRLADAIGQDNAQALLQHVDSAYLSAQKIANRNRFIGNAAKAVGLGGIGYEATKFAHDLLGSK